MGVVAPHYMNGWMSSEKLKYWWKGGCGQSQCIILKLAEWTKENCVKPVTVNGILSNIKTEYHSLNTVPQLAWCICRSQPLLLQVTFHHKNTRTSAKNTWCVDTIFIDSPIDCFLNHVCMVVVSQVLQHVNSCIQHGNWVGNVLPCNCCSRVACAWLKYGILSRKTKVI